jgi:hypothetical protein
MDNVASVPPGTLLTAVVTYSVLEYSWSGAAVCEVW